MTTAGTVVIIDTHSLTGDGVIYIKTKNSPHPFRRLQGGYFFLAKIATTRATSEIIITENEIISVNAS